MGHKLVAVLITLGIVAVLRIPSCEGTWGVYSQPGFDEGRSIAATSDSVFVAGLSIGSFDGYRLVKYNAYGDMVWEKQFPIPERRMTKEGHRNIALTASSDSINVAFTNGTFVVKAFHTNGTKTWKNRWRRQCSVTDMAIAGNHTIVAGCTDGVNEARFHVVAFDASGTMTWNTSGRGCIYGIDVDGDTLLIAGERDGAGILMSMNKTGGIAGIRSFAPGAVRDVVATPKAIVLLHSTGGNISIVMVPSVADGNITRHDYDGAATGNALLWADGRVFIAGNVYNQSSRHRDFLVAEYLSNGTFNDVVRHNANGSGDDIAWDIAELDDILATGAVYTSRIIYPPEGMPYSVLNREIYTVPYQPANLPPSANVTWTPETPRANDPISFDGTASDPDGSVVQWTWSFGDGATASQKNPSHTYADKGVYTVALTVQDDDGATATATREIVVAEEEKTPGFSAAVACLAGVLALAIRRRLTFK